MPALRQKQSFELWLRSIIGVRGVIAKTRADHLALARNSISPSKSILREGEHGLRITILIAMAYGNATVTARSLKYLTTLANGAPKEVRTPAPRFVVRAGPLKSLRSVTVRMPVNTKTSSRHGFRDGSALPSYSSGCVTSRR